MKCIVKLVAPIAAIFAIWLFKVSEQQTTIEYDSIYADTVCTDTIELTRLTCEDTLFAMAEAFANVESRYNPKAVSPCGKYVGYLQIGRICVDEANRILGEKRYVYDDRYEREHSLAIFNIVQQHHNPTLDIDRAVDIWNKRCQKAYRDSVKAHYSYNLMEARYKS